MSMETMEFHRLTCDEPDCDLTYPEEGEEVGWYADIGALEEDAEYDRWQTVGREHYCPLHTHAACTECGRAETGDLIDLEDAGWTDPCDFYAVCPQCAKGEEA